MATMRNRPSTTRGQINPGPQKIPRDEAAERATNKELQAAAERGAAGISGDRQSTIDHTNVPPTSGSVHREIDRVVRLLESGSSPSQKEAAALIREAVDTFIREAVAQYNGSDPDDDMT